MKNEFNEMIKELDTLILMRQSPNEGYSSDQMDKMIQEKIRQVSDLKYNNWKTFR